MAVAPDWESYANGICAEIDFWSEKLSKIKIPTIFFGGGTPSLMPIDVFQSIMKRLADKFDLSECDEVTLESNPGTITDDKLKDFIASGVNRLSIGVQSLDDAELQFLGRKHDVKTAIHLIEQAQKTGIRVSADFIYGLPNHTVKNIVSLCDEINRLGLHHASLYELTIEPNTPFGKMNLNMPTNDEMADMYLAVSDNLNLPRYEVSNYATPGEECKHNQNIWDGDAYIGLGNGAKGRIFMNNTWFEQSGGDIKFSEIDNKTRAIERLITGLRTMRGVLIDNDIKNVIDIDFINAHNDLVRVNNNRITATNKGLLILDDLLVDITK